MKKSHLIGALCAVVFAVISMSSQAALIGVLPATLNGTDYQAYYDTATDLTWLANANAGAGSAYDDGSSTTDGAMSWAAANTWAAGLNINDITGWRLPDTNPVNGTAYNYNFAYDGSTDYGYNVSAPGTDYAGSTGSEMAYLFYNTLGNPGYCDPALSTASSCSGPQAGWGVTNTGPFSNVQSANYWSATEYAPNTSNAWIFNMLYGSQGSLNKSFSYSAWAVQSGNVGGAVVPVPAAVWLFGSGLLGLIGVARKN